MRINMLKLKDDQPRNLMGANKSRMLVCGRAKVPIFINNVLVTHEFFIVKNLICKVILGIDFLEKTEAQINVRDRIITFFDGTVKLQLTGRRDNFQVAFVAKTQTLKPKTERLVELKVIRPFHSKAVVLLQPNELRPVFGAAVAHCITAGKGRRLMCRVFNATESDLLLRKKAKLATAERTSCNAIHGLNGTEMPGRG